MRKKTMQDLPIGIQDFEQLRRENYVYVDKTRFIYHFARKSTPCFLSRPRRFGKSLLCSTFKALFQGKRDLFKGLWIDQPEASWEWKEHPVIHLSMSTLDKQTIEKLESGLSRELFAIARSYNVDTAGAEQTPKGLLVHLVRELTKRAPVVVLIDEYDKPILDQIAHPEKAIAMRECLRNFYEAFKDLQSHLRFLFITGVTKFSRTSIFSGLNHLLDLTMHPDSVTLCGYTENEIKTTFTEHLRTTAQQRGETVDHVLEQIKTWYDGYRFDYKNCPHVFTPFSVIQFFDTGRFANYWFETGTPTYLMHLLRREGYPLNLVRQATLSREELLSFDIERENLTTILYQAGYLTIKSVSGKEGSEQFLLEPPNEEVRVSLLESIYTYISRLRRSSLDPYVAKLHDALAMGDLELFCSLFKTFLANIPYNIQVPLEKYYQSIFFIVCFLLGGKPTAEDITNIGRIDLVLEHNNHVYLIEFKINRSVDEALSQIERSDYSQKFLHQGKQVVMIGINFIKDERSADMAWKIKNLMVNAIKS